MNSARFYVKLTTVPPRKRRKCLPLPLKKLMPGTGVPEMGMWPEIEWLLYCFVFYNYSCLTQNLALISFFLF